MNNEQTENRKAERRGLRRATGKQFSRSQKAGNYPSYSRTRPDKGQSAH